MRKPIEILTGHNFKRYFILYSAFLIYSLATVSAKLASLQKIISIQFFLFLALEILILGVYAIIWQQALKKFSLITAMSNKGVVVILGLLWSAKLFNEKITIYNIIGAAVIIIGIWVVSKDG